MTDKDMIECVHEDIKKGYQMVMKEYLNLVYAIVLNKLKADCNKEDIEDCVSEVFIEVFEGIYQFDYEKGALKTYISTIAKRTAIDYWRKKKREQLQVAGVEDMEELEDIDSPKSSVFEMVNQKEEKQRLYQAILDLGEPDTTIILRKYFYGETAKQIAKKLSMSVSSVHKRAERALKKLRIRLEGLHE